MAKEQSPDIVEKRFWENNERFADLFNAFFFDGEPVIDPNLLQERNTDVAASIPLRNLYEHVKKYEDVSKIYQGAELSILGIENQSNVHYGMPLRARLYDDLDMLKESAALLGIRRTEKGISQKEWLSGMKKGDRLHMSLRIVIYYGEDPWDGPRKLSDMVEIPNVFKPFFQDYVMPLVCINEKDNYVRCYKNESIKNLMTQLYLVYQKAWDEIRKMDVELDNDTADVLGAVTNNKVLIEASKAKGGIRMCTALEQLREEGREEGHTEGYNEHQRETIIRMLKADVDVATIANFNGATIEMVNQIKKENNL